MWPFRHSVSAAPSGCFICDPKGSGICDSCAEKLIGGVANRSGLSYPSWSDSKKIAPPVEPEPVPVATEIIAWRAWSLVEDDWNRPMLKSVSQGTLWDGPTLRADKTPKRDTPHGIYARKSLETLGEYGGQPVVGSIALSGIVVEADNGYRAEVATIRSLKVRQGVAGRYCLLEACGYLADRYQVEPEVCEWPVAVSYGLSSGLSSIFANQSPYGLSAQRLHSTYNQYIAAAMQNAFGYQKP